MCTCWRHSGESGGPIYHQYPPFFYSELRKFAVLSCPRKSAMGFRSPGPEDVMGKLGQQHPPPASPSQDEEDFNHYHQRNVCWRSRDDIMFVYCILSILLAQYTHEFLFLLINQMFGVKKKTQLHLMLICLIPVSFQLSGDIFCHNSR